MKIPRCFAVLLFALLPLASTQAGDDHAFLYSTITSNGPSVGQAAYSMLTPIIPPCPAQVVATLPGHAVAPLSGQVVPPLPGQLVSALPNQITGALSGQIVPALPGQVVSSLSGQLVGPLAGQLDQQFPGWKLVGFSK